jgi:hypothetical protein
LKEVGEHVVAVVRGVEHGERALAGDQLVDAGDDAGVGRGAGQVGDPLVLGAAGPGLDVDRATQRWPRRSNRPAK